MPGCMVKVNESRQMQLAFRAALPEGSDGKLVLFCDMHSTCSMHFEDNSIYLPSYMLNVDSTCSWARSGGLFDAG